MCLFCSLETVLSKQYSAPLPVRILYFDQALRAGWPATEWETGSEPKMAENGWRNGRQPFSGGGGPKKAQKIAGQIAGHAQNHQILAVRPFFGHFGTPQKMAAGHFAGHFSAIFGSEPVSHSVAGRPGRKPSEDCF